MPTTTDYLSLTATVASAIAGAFAAWAAYRSAQSARVAQQAADKADLRAALREVATTANAIIAEKERIESRVAKLRLSYSSLFALSGASTSSNLPLYISAIDGKLARASTLAEDANLFASGAGNLAQCPTEEVDRVQLRLRGSLVVLQGTREDLESEHASVESQCAERRGSMDRTRLAR